MRRNDRANFDVIVLGAGISGTIMAAILARHGYSVVILDGGVHPRFVVGESTIPQTSQLLSLLAQDTDVPELHTIGLGTPGLLRKHVTSNCGIKRLFGFVYHREGKELDPNLAHQFGNVWRDENHLFRQDVDAWLMLVALKYGAFAVQNVRIESVELKDKGVEVFAGGTRYRGKFVVDGTGFRSVVADKLKLREEPCSLVSRTRCLFTHMIDVTPFEEVHPTPMQHKWSQGTLHHCFKRGWFWVIPFNNWEGSPNPLVSVAVSLDDEMYPEEAGTTPEEEFRMYLKRYPTVERQFRKAKLARPWVRTKRLQYWSKRTAGARWAMTSHAAGFVDALFSRGLITTIDNLRSLSKALLSALKDNEFSDERMAQVDQEQTRNITFADRIVYGAYTSWDDFDLWNAWVRLWAVGVHDTESRLGSVLMMGKHSKYKPLPNPIASYYEAPGYRALFEEMYGVIRKYDTKKLPLSKAKAGLWNALKRYEYSFALRDGFKHHEWALTNPLSRDCFLGVPENHERWGKKLPDPHLAKRRMTALPVGS